MNTNLYFWCTFLFITVVVAIYWGLPQPFGKALATLFWFLMLLVLIFGGRLG